MADFDPFANQGGPAAWDPEHRADAKKFAAELREKIAETENEPGSGPSTYSDAESTPEASDPSATTFENSGEDVDRS